MHIEFTKGIDCDYINILRDDGSRVSTTFPKKGWFPHDVVHLVVEKQLGFGNGFWGLVATGIAPDEVGAMAKAAGHASTKRAGKPEQAIVELVQSERVVECFEAEMWGEPTDFETFAGVLSAACEQSFVPVPKISEEDVAAIRSELDTLGAKWLTLSTGEVLEMSWR